MKVIGFESCYCSDLFFVWRILKIKGNFGIKRPVNLVIYQKWAEKYDLKAKTTFISEKSPKRKIIGTVTCLKPDNFHKVKKNIHNHRL